MPFPCSAPSSSDLAGLPVVKSSLQSTGAPAANADVKPDDSTPDSFDHVLSGLNDSDSSSSTKDEPTDASKTPSDASATPEQLAMLAAFLVPSPAALPGQPPAPVAATPGEASLTLVGAEGRRVPELLARGVETLEYNVSKKNSPANGPAAPNLAAVSNGSPDKTTSAFATADSSLGVTAQHSSATIPTAPPLAVSGAAKAPAPAGETKTVTITPASDAAAATATPAALLPQEGTAADALRLGNLQANLAGGNAPRAVLGSKALPKTKLADALEKTAASSSAAARSGAFSSIGHGKNLSLVVEGKELKHEIDNLGTAAANWGKSMYQDLHTFADAAMRADSHGIGAAAGSGTVTTRETAPPTAALPSHAGELVHEIREIADGLWAVERNSVEVKFNFGQQDKLSVRVEYRDGTVNTTFRTDSADLRDAIAREWRSQSAVGEQRPYRMADPVFSASPSPSNFSMGGDASRQQRSSEQPAPAERFFLGSAPRSGGSMTTSPVVSPTTRPDTAGRLHAIA